MFLLNRRSRHTRPHGARKLCVGGVLHLHVHGGPWVVRPRPLLLWPDVPQILNGLGDLELGHGGRAHGGGGRGDVVVVGQRRRWLLLYLLLVLLVVGSADGRVVEVDVAWWLGEFALGLEEAGLEVDDVVAELVVLGLKGFEVFAEQVVVADLLLEFLNVAFFALSESSLLGANRVVRC